ncbi:MAG: dihydrofolate reductase [Candidatus Eremiobacteraeota bacterium]|nr:dihydrofolate reductase [Candidatus Eremiobacteraeota bacterium]
MGTIVESTLVSLDGVIEDPAAWAGEYIDDEFQKAGLERLLVSDAMVMGRTTYELLASDWAGGTGAFADRVNGIRKYVFSSTLERADWNNSTIIRGDVVSEARKLKEHARNDLALWGHGLFGETLLKHGLLDEMRLSVFPLFVGKGKLLFRESETARLRLIDATSLPNGVVVTRYQPMH